MQKSNVITLLFSLFFVFSCDSNRVFDTYKTVPDSWNKNEVIEFKVNSLDTITPCNLFVNLRNTKAYKYSNLFLIVEMNFPHGKTIKDTLEYRMASPDGTLLGTGLSSKENKLWYKEAVVFDEVGEYTVKIQHAMRKNGTVKGVASLEGVTDVGFRIEKSLKK